MQLLENIAEYLETEGFGTRGTDIFIGFAPESEDDTENNIIMFDQTGGIEPDRDLPIAKPTVQVIVRNTDYKTGFNILQDIFDRFHRMNDSGVLVSGGVDVMRAYAINEVQPLGVDVKERYSFTVTFVFQYRK